MILARSARPISDPAALHIGSCASGRTPERAQIVWKILENYARGTRSCGAAKERTSSFGKGFSIVLNSANFGCANSSALNRSLENNFRRPGPIPDRQLLDLAMLHEAAVIR